MANISVPREPTEAMLNAPLMGGRFESRLDLRPHIYKAMLDAAPAVEVEGLEVVGWLSAFGAVYDKESGLVVDEPLCSLPKAQAIIDQQAARIAELQLDADRYRWIEANSTYGIDYRQRIELTLPIYAPDHHKGLDAAIDAAMGEKHE